MEEKKLSPEEGKLVGKISHYFGKIGVGIVELSDDVGVGDTIRVIGGEVDFEQTVDSMEVDHQQIQKAKAGDSIGLKLEQKVREGYQVYKV
jgi:putative protease